MIKKILIAIMVAIPMLASAQTIKIGVVDTQKLVAELPAFKEAQTKIEAIAKKYDDEYANLRTEATKKLEEFQTISQDANTPQAVKERRAKELDEFSQKLSEFEQMAQQDLQKQQQEIFGPVYSTVQDAIKSIGKEGNYTFIQEAAAFLYYGAPAEDITNQVKARLGVK
ncbi:MAG: OmpH family outer membrane protein [Prevotella sp.]|nr:OmpH family outer membrane protein [Prevotella sp.]MCM1074244.1 OmpH family outer membrane protein [Ruminococcus sp.]